MTHQPAYRGHDTILFQGKSYKIGQGQLEPIPLPDFVPSVLPVGWEMIGTNGWTAGPDPEYARAYSKHGTLRVLISCAKYCDGKRWLHVSVSRRNHEPPSWQCMSEVKDLFIGQERTALQVHPPRSKHVNIHPGVLHLWCCLDGEVTPDFTAGGETI